MKRIAVFGTIGLVGLALAFAFTPDSAGELYITAPVERGTIASHVRATGIVDPVMTVDVSSQLSGRVAEVLVNFNDEVKQDQVIARLDPQVYDARVNEAEAALKVARANALLRKASLERAVVALRNSETAREMEVAQLHVAQATQEELERDYQRYSRLAQSGSIAERDMTQARSRRDAGAASLHMIDRQIKMKSEAIEMARADISMARANLANADAVVEQKQAALDQANWIADVRKFVHRSTVSSSNEMSIPARRLRSPWRRRRCSGSPTTCGKWRFAAGSTRPMSGNSGSDRPQAL